MAALGDLDLAAEKIAKMQAQAGHVDERKLARVVDIDHDVDVAVGPRLAARDRTEQGEVNRAAGAQLVRVRPKRADRLVATQWCGRDGSSHGGGPWDAFHHKKYRELPGKPRARRC